VRGAARLTALLLTAAAAGAYVYLQSHMRFAFWDDEGHLLMDLTRAVAGRPLYDDVFTVYGPAHLLPRMLFFQNLGAAPTHDWNRVFTAVSWFGTAGLGAGAVYLFTRSWPFATAMLALLTVFLTALRDGPAHAQETAMVLLGAAAVCCALLPRWPVMASGCLGVITGSLLLTKVNLGLFAIAGVSLGLGGLVASRRLRRLAATASAPAAASPFVLMFPHLSQPWVLGYALLSAATAAAATVAAWRQPKEGAWEGLPARCAPAALAGFAASAAGLLGGVCLAGSTLSGALYMLFVWPLRFPGQAIGHLDPGAGVAVAALGLAGLTLAAALGFRGRDGGSGLVLDLLKAVAGTVAIAAALSGNMVLTMALIAPGVPLLLIRSAGASSRYHPASRRVLAALAVFENLQAYPVPGAQVIWANYLPLIVMAVNAYDGWSGLVAAAGAIRWRRGVALAAAGTAPAAALGLLVALTLWKAHPLTTAADWRHRPRLGLPGAQNLRLNVDQNARLNWAVANIRARCDTLLGRPALNSINLWSGRLPETRYYSGAWPLIHSEAEQRDMLRAVAGGQRPCALEFPLMSEFWSRGAGFPASELGAWVDSLPRASAIDHFDLRSREAWPTDYLIHGVREFDGRSDAVGVPGAVLRKVTGWTIRLRVRTSAAGPLLGGQSPRMFTPHPEQGTALLKVLSDGRVEAALPGMTTRVVSARSVFDGEWHDVTLSAGSGGLSLIADGSEPSRWQGTAPPLTMAHYQLGAAWDEGAWRFFRGSLANVTITRDSGALLVTRAQEGDNPQRSRSGRDRIRAGLPTAE